MRCRAIARLPLSIPTSLGTCTSPDRTIDVHCIYTTTTTTTTTSTRPVLSTDSRPDVETDASRPWLVHALYGALQPFTSIGDGRLALLLAEGPKP